MISGTFYDSFFWELHWYVSTIQHKTFGSIFSSAGTNSKIPNFKPLNFSNHGSLNFEHTNLPQIDHIISKGGKNVLQFFTKYVPNTKLRTFWILTSEPMSKLNRTRTLQKLRSGFIPAIIFSNFLNNFDLADIMQFIFWQTEGIDKPYQMLQKWRDFFQIIPRQMLVCYSFAKNREGSITNQGIIFMYFINKT